MEMVQMASTHDISTHDIIKVFIYNNSLNLISYPIPVGLYKKGNKLTNER